MRKIRGCNLCTLGDDCMCHRVVRWNNIRNINTPPDFKEGYRRKYLINIYGIDPDDHTNLDRWCEIHDNYTLPYLILDDGSRLPNPACRYNGDDGYNRFIRDLEALKPKPVPW